MRTNIMASVVPVRLTSRSQRHSRRLKRAISLAMMAVSFGAYERLMTAPANAINDLLTANDGGNKSSFDPSGTTSPDVFNWTDGVAPNAANTYEDTGANGKALIRVYGSATFGGQSLQLDKDGYLLFKNAGIVDTVNSLILNGGIIDNGGLANPTLAGNLSLNTSSTSYISARATSTNFTISSNISGSGNLIINNEDSTAGTNSGQGTINFTSGIVTFSGSNSYTGTTNISQGTLNLSASGTPDAYTGAFLGTGTLGIVGSGTVVLSASNTFSGTAMLATSGATLQINNTSSLQSAAVTVSGGTLAFNSGVGNYTLGSLAGNGTLALTDIGNSPIALTVGNASSTIFSGSLTGAGSLTKVGTGKLTLSGADTRTGVTNINAGGILLSGTSTTPSLTINSGAYLSATGNGTSSGMVAGTVTVAAGGAIDFSKDGASTTAQILGVGGLNLIAGSTAANSSNLTYNVISPNVSDSIASSGPVNIAGGGQTFINLGGSYSAGTYTLLTYPNRTGIAPAGVYTNGTAGEPFVIGNGFPGAFSYQFNDSSTSLTLQVTFVPVTAYWYGAYAGGSGATGTFGGTNGTLSNFSSDAGGTVDSNKPIGAGTDVVFTAAQSGSSGPSLSGQNINAILDANYSVNSLTINSTPASTTISGTGTNLTIVGGIGNLYSSGGTGIMVNSGAGSVTINTSGKVIPSSS